MSNALTIIPKTIDEVHSLAEVLAKSTLLPDALRGKVPDVVVSILAGQELGLAPMAAIRGVYVVQGKPVLSADTMVALVLKSGLAEYFTCIEDTDARVTYETKRMGSPIAQKLSWTTEDTKRAGLNTKDNWRLHTRAMMKARAKAALARDVYPDVLAGCHEDNEAPQPVRATVAEDVIDAEIVETFDPVTAINACNTEDELKALAPKLASLPDAAKKEATAVYKARLAAIRGVAA